MTRVALYPPFSLGLCEICATPRIDLVKENIQMASRGDDDLVFELKSI